MTEHTNLEDFAWLTNLKVGDIIPTNGYQARQKKRIEKIRNALDEIMPKRSEVRVSRCANIDLTTVPKIALATYGMQEIRSILSRAAGFQLPTIHQNGENKRYYGKTSVGRNRPPGFALKTGGYPRGKYIPIWTYAGKTHDRGHQPDLAWEIEYALMDQYVGIHKRMNGPILATGLAKALIELLATFSTRPGKERNLRYRFTGYDGTNEITSEYGDFPQGFVTTLKIKKNLIDATLLSYDDEYEFTGTTLKFYRKMADMFPESVLTGAIGKRMGDIIESDVFAQDMRKITSAKRMEDPNRGRCVVFGIETAKQAYVMENDEILTQKIEEKYNAIQNQ